MPSIDLQDLFASREVGIYRENDNIALPEYEHPDDAGFDLRAYGFEFYGTRENEIDGILTSMDKGSSFALLPHSRVFCHTGLHLDIPKGYYVSINPRSGLACKKGITVANAPGIVDSSYKGEIIVCLLNTSDYTRVIEYGSRIAQAILQPYTEAKFNSVDSIDKLGTSDRGSNGFGSTGTN